MNNEKIMLMLEEITWAQKSIVENEKQKYYKKHNRVDYTSRDTVAMWKAGKVALRKELRKIVKNYVKNPSEEGYFYMKNYHTSLKQQFGFALIEPKKGLWFYINSEQAKAGVNVTAKTNAFLQTYMQQMGEYIAQDPVLKALNNMA